MKKRIYKIYDYDVWGNTKEGYYVNDVFATDFIVELPENATDLEIIKELKNIGFLGKYIRNKSIEIDGDSEVLYINYVTQKEGIYPVCELRLLT